MFAVCVWEAACVFPASFEDQNQNSNLSEQLGQRVNVDDKERFNSSFTHPDAVTAATEEAEVYSYLRIYGTIFVFRSSEKIIPCGRIACWEHIVLHRHSVHAPFTQHNLNRNTRNIAKDDRNFRIRVIEIQIGSYIIWLTDEAALVIMRFSVSSVGMEYLLQHQTISPKNRSFAL